MDLPAPPVATNRMSWLLRFMSLYPPFIGAGVRVTRASSDLLEVDVEMKLRFWNRNFFGTHFGGSLYSMIDPFYALMVAGSLGRDFVVWDKAAAIRFRRPGRGTVRAKFRLTPDDIEAIRFKAQRDGKVEPVFQVLVRDAEGQVVAEAEKTLHVRWTPAGPG